MLHDHPILDAVLRLALAFVLVLPLGWQRERRSRSAGLRTYPLLSACICGFFLVARTAAGGPSAEADVFYGVLGGIGFVGAGAIVKSPESARGMSAAVTLWVTGAIGAGVAYGLPAISAALALTSALTQWTTGAPARRPS
jgi:putative Mg2+ transporter-C (MgtC) family protein